MNLSNCSKTPKNIELKCQFLKYEINKVYKYDNLMKRVI